jgi:hypothetical protein
MRCLDYLGALVRFGYLSFVFYNMLAKSMLNLFDVVNPSLIFLKKRNFRGFYFLRAFNVKILIHTYLIQK